MKMAGRAPTKRDRESRNLLERAIADALFWILLLFLFTGIIHIYWIPLKTLLFA